MPNPFIRRKCSWWNCTDVPKGMVSGHLLCPKHVEAALDDRRK